MDSFLEESSQLGRLDSQGHFEISGEAGRIRVSTPEHWILKMVQAAVSGAAERLEVRQSRNEIRLWFHFADPPLPREVFDAVFAPDKPTQPYLSEMAIGLRSLLMTREFILGSTEGAPLHWNGSVLQRASRGAPEAGFEIIVKYALAPCRSFARAPGESARHGWRASAFQDSA